MSPTANEAAANIGLIGLGVMGANLALNIADHAFPIAVYNRTNSTTVAFMESAGDLGDRITACDSLQTLVDSMATPRVIVLMVTAGPVVDLQIDALLPLLAAGDIIVDAGNANYHDSRRRAARMATEAVNFVGMGVSGGEQGARFGPAIMVGGDADNYQILEPMLSAIAADYEGTPCCAHVGVDGAGHFVKTLHNGIEYADMQMIAEVYQLLSELGGLEAAEIGQLFERWNNGALQSYLIEISAAVLQAVDPDTGLPMVDIILDRAGQKGTGGWASIESIAMGAPATTLIEAVGARAVSSLLAERRQAAQIYPVGSNGVVDNPDALADTLEQALLAGKICAYAQGFSVLDAASAEYKWNLPFAQIAQIWRAGCIIRSRFLDDIATAFSGADTHANLLLARHFSAIMNRTQQPLRDTVALAAASAVPVPALGSALAYFDGYRRVRTSANMIQAQRDYFGAHGFERVDRDGRDYHGPWALNSI